MRQELTSTKPAHWTRAWDGNACARAAELYSNSDVSYRSLTHHVVQHLADAIEPGSRVLDVGCGIGALTASLADLDYSITGIDPSHASIEVAKKHNPDLDLRPVSIEKFAPSAVGQFHAVVANMVLHSVADLNNFLTAVQRVLAADGVLVATIPHPRFYLQQRADVDFNDSAYDDSRVHWIPFRIHGCEPHPNKVPYYHRPTEEYLEQLTRHGLSITRFEQPPQVGIGKPHDVLLLRAHSSAADNRHAARARR